MNEPRYGETMKSKGGLTRLLNAMKYTWHGLRSAATHEEAFRQELIVVVPLSIAAWFLPGVPPAEKAVLFGVLQLILVVELINSAIEANTDHITLERHPLAKRAKDMGSAAVFLTILVATATWAAVIWTRFF